MGEAKDDVVYQSMVAGVRQGLSCSRTARKTIGTALMCMRHMYVMMNTEYSTISTLFYF
jgi:hypothetical protein